MTKVVEQELEIKQKEDNEELDQKNSPRVTAKNILKIIFKIISLLSCLYFFIVSLDLMSTSFRLIGMKYASDAFKTNAVLTNPVAGLVIGVIVTVVVQSSSTSTSIVVSIVSSGILEVKYAIPIIMGANIGTSVTSTLVSLAQSNDKENFRRAFAGATVHDSFNLLSVLVLLPIEIISGYLEHFSGALVKLFLSSSSTSAKEPQLLTVITKPLTNLIIQLDKKALETIAKNSSNFNGTLIKHNCPKNVTVFINETYLTKLDLKRCKFLVEPLTWPEWGVGILLLAVSLIVLCACLILMVKILSSIFKGPVARVIQKVVNSDLPGRWNYLTGLIAILLGCGLTIIVQSSSVFTSTLVPLVGMDLISVERLFPLTLGSNLGTTITGILASFSSSPDTLKNSLQIALCHSLFNISGILIWYPIPILRRVPIRMSKFLGDISSEYRWFAIAYLVFTFLLIPGIIFGLSLAGLAWFLGISVPILVIFICILVINFLQIKLPITIDLPKVLKTWEFLPTPLRSLKPYDNFIHNYVFFRKRSKVKPNLNQAEDGFILEIEKNSNITQEVVNEF